MKKVGISNFSSRLWKLAGFAALAVLAAACTGQQAPTSWPGMTVEGDTVYLAYGQQVYALNIENGTPRWSFPAERDNRLTFFAEPAVEDSLLIAGGFDSSVYALNPETGLSTWPQPFTEAADHIVGGSIIADGIVYVPSADYNLYALDANGGNRLWSFKADQAIWAQPLLDGDRLYITSLDHHIYALNAADGSLVWEQQLGGAIAGTPVLVDGRLIVGAFDKKLYALDSEDGSIVWSQPTDGWVWSGPLVEEDTLYYGDLEGFLYAAEAETGAQIWKVKPGGAIRATPALSGDTLYVPARDGFLYFRSKANGEPVGPREVELTGQLLVSPVVVDNTVIVAAYGAQENRLVFALDAGSGAQRWSFVAP